MERCNGQRSNAQETREMSKKLVPAVFFQKQLNGPTMSRKKPERLVLLESELAQVTGGVQTSPNTDSCSGGCLDDSCDPMI
jgi:hypothetical protein